MTGSRVPATPQFVSHEVAALRALLEAVRSSDGTGQSRARAERAIHAALQQVEGLWQTVFAEGGDGGNQEAAIQALGELLLAKRGEHNDWLPQRVRGEYGWRLR